MRNPSVALLVFGGRMADACAPAPASGAAVSFSVKSLTGKEFRFSLPPTTTFRELQTLIHAQSGAFSPLIFHGRRVRMRETLADLNVTDGSVMHLVITGCFGNGARAPMFEAKDLPPRAITRVMREFWELATAPDEHRACVMDYELVLPLSDILDGQRELYASLRGMPALREKVQWEQISEEAKRSPWAAQRLGHWFLTIAPRPTVRTYLVQCVRVCVCGLRVCVCVRCDLCASLT